MMGDEVLPFLHGIIETLDAKGTETAESGGDRCLPSLIDGAKSMATKVRLDALFNLVSHSQTELSEKLFYVAEELQRLKAQTERHGDQAELISDIRKLHAGLQESHESKVSELQCELLELRGILQEVKCTHHSSLDDLHTVTRSQAALSETVSAVVDELQGLKAHALRHDRHEDVLNLRDAAISDIQSLHDRLQQSHEDKFSSLRSELLELRDLLKDVKSNCDAGLQELHLEVARKTQQSLEAEERLDSKLSAWSSEMVTELSFKISSAIEESRHDWQSRLDEINIDSALDDDRREWNLQLQEVRDHGSEENRKLRTEVKDALVNEANIISSLEEQLWQTCEYLGRRIDEVSRTSSDSMRILSARIREGILEYKPDQAATVSRSPRSERSPPSTTSPMDPKVSCRMVTCSSALKPKVGEGLDLMH